MAKVTVYERSTECRNENMTDTQWDLVKYRAFTEVLDVPVSAFGGNAAEARENLAKRIESMFGNLPLPKEIASIPSLIRAAA